MTDVVALLKSAEVANTVEVQARGYSLELTLPENFEEAWSTMEACRRSATTRSSSKVPTWAPQRRRCMRWMSRSVRLSAARRRIVHLKRAIRRLASRWICRVRLAALPSGAKQLRYRKGEYVLREGAPQKPSIRSYRGQLRVELQLKDQPTAVVVGHRGAGEMFGETSLLKAGVATASIVTDSEEAILVCIDGMYLETLFTSHPALGRFFAFLASYQVKRLRVLTDQFSSDNREVAGQHLANVSVDEIFCNPAYMGIFRKFMSKTADAEPAGSAAREAYAMSLAMFEFWMDVQDFRTEPTLRS